MNYTSGRGIITARRNIVDPRLVNHFGTDTTGMSDAFGFPKLYPEEDAAHYVRHTDRDCIDRESRGTHRLYTRESRRWHRKHLFYLCRECSPQMELPLRLC